MTAFSCLWSNRNVHVTGLAVCRVWEEGKDWRKYYIWRKQSVSTKHIFSFLQFDITTIQIRRDTTGENYWDFCTLVWVPKTMPYINRCFQAGRGSFIRHLYARLQRSPAHKFTRSDFYRWNYSRTFTPRHIVSRAEGCNFHFQPCKRLNIFRKCNNLHLIREYFLASDVNFFRLTMKCKFSFNWGLPDILSVPHKNSISGHNFKKK